ncbi:MAG: hypothetical protein QM796_02275 [Chthoniobacteraceae bacterium]
MNKRTRWLLVIMLVASESAYSGPDEKNEVSEARQVLSVVDERMATLRDEIPTIQAKLKQSRKDYKKLLAKTPKGYVLMCGDSISENLERELVEYKADLKSLQKEKDKYKNLSNKDR